MELYIDRGEWFLENRVPKLGEVRGKGILMSRFGGSVVDGGTGPWEVDTPITVGNRNDDDDEGEGEGGNRGAGQEVKKEVRMGWRPSRWPNSVVEGFEWDCGGVGVRVQDWLVG